MANRRLQSLLEANKQGLTLRYDPPASRNLCFYRCLSKFVDVKEEDIVQMVQRHLLCNQMVTCANEDGTSETQDLMQFLSDTDYPSLGNRPSTWRDCVLALKDEMATHVVIRAAATLLSLNVNIIDWNGRINIVKPFSGSAASSVCLAYTGNHYMLLTSKASNPVMEDMQSGEVKAPERHKGAKTFYHSGPEEYHPGVSIFKGKPLKLEVSPIVISSDDEVISGYVDTESKDCVNISSDGSDVVPLIKGKRRKRRRPKKEAFKEESSVEDLVTSMSGLSSTDNTPVKKAKRVERNDSKWSKQLFSEDEDDDAIIQRGNRCYINQENVDNMEAVQVAKVPTNPCGPVKYDVDYNEKDPLRNISDNWNWDRAQPCQRKGFCKGGRRTLQMCRGSLECQNPKCQYKKIHKFANKVDFNRTNKCVHCKHEATRMSCSARKYIENDRCHKKMTVIYIGNHFCSPRAQEEKPEKEEVENIIRERPNITTGQIQLEKVRQALLSGSDAESLENVALKFSNTRHLRYLHTSVNKTARPGGSDIEAIRLLKEDFMKRGLDAKLIMDVGEESVILSSEQKTRIAALITLGQIEEPVSLDGCESHANGFTEIELTTYHPVLRRNVKLVSMFVPKPGENSENIETMINTFDEAVNDILPSVAREHGLDPEEFKGRGLDAHAYVGDEGGALWSGLCKAKGDDIKNKTVSDFFHIKQDIRRHFKYFKTDKDQKHFEKIMIDAYNAPTSIQADEAKTALENLISKRSTNVQKMKNFTAWWWRRRSRWQQWCRSYSSSSASSAEVSNAKSISASGYRKRLLDVVTTECSAAILEAAEIKRQVLGQKTVGEGPTAADREEKEQNELLAGRDACASAVQYIAENAESLTGTVDFSTDVETAQKDYRVNTKDSHRSDRTKRKPKSKKTSDTEAVPHKKHLRYFARKVDEVTMDLLECNSTMNLFKFKILDTMGYLEDVTLAKDSASCTSLACRKNCHHLVWVLHNVFHFSKDEPLIYKKTFTQAEWQKIINAFPEKVPLSQLPKVTNQVFQVNVRKTAKEAKCAICKKTITTGDLQASTEGAYRTIHRTWILRTFFFCPSVSCITKMPRNSFIIPFSPSQMTLRFDPDLTQEQRLSVGIL